MGKRNLVAFPIGRLGVFAVVFNRMIRAHPVAAIAAFLLLSVFVTIFDSFGVEQRTDQAAAVGTSAVLSPLYGGLDRVGQDAITVVSVDERVAQLFGSSFWPLPYSGQLALVDAIMRHDPAVVFLDFTYQSVQAASAATAIPQDWPGSEGPDIAALQPQPSFSAVMAADAQLAAFAEGLDALARHYAVPVIIGPVGEADALAPLRDAFPPLSRLDQAGPGQAGVLIPDDPIFSYPFREPEGPRVQAAFMMREHVCARRAERPDLYIPCASFDAPAPALDDAELFLSWGLGGPRSMSALYSAADLDRCVAVGLGERWRHAFALAMRGISGSDARSGQGYAFGCSYHNTLTAADILRFTFDPVEPEAGVDTFDASVWLRDRAVLVGADIEALSDSFQTPVYGEVPGVALHAMALDNLIEMGDRFTRQPPGLIFSMDAADLVEFVFIVLALSAIVAVARSAPADGEERRVQNANGVYVLLVVAVTAAAALVIGLMRWPAVNLLFMAAGLSFAASWIDTVCAERRSAASTLHSPE